eukprot:3940483-Rhodomonas_salina.3
MAITLQIDAMLRISASNHATHTYHGTHRIIYITLRVGAYLDVQYIVLALDHLSDLYTRPQYRTRDLHTLPQYRTRDPRAAYARSVPACTRYHSRVVSAPYVC